MKKLIFLICLISLAGLVGYRAYDTYKAKAAAPGKGAMGRGPGGGGSSVMRMPLVETYEAKEGTLQDKVLLVGSLRPIAEVQVMSKISGRVQKVTADIGDFVHAGDLLAQVEDREILQQIEQAEASLAVNNATIRQREAELANYERQVKRYRDLFEDDLIARQDLEDVLTRQQTSQAQLALGKAMLRQSEAMLNQYKINLENTRVYAPMNGFISKRFLHPGALVSMNTPILSLVDLSTLRVVVNAVEKDIVRIQKGGTVDVMVDAFPEKVFTGKIQRVSPVLDPATRTGEVEVYVSNPQQELRAEMFARINFTLGGEHQGLLIPREAIVYRGDESGVFVLDGNVASFRAIKAGVTQQSMVVVLGGLKPGDKVITMGASLLKDGDRVRFREAASDERPAV